MGRPRSTKLCTIEGCERKHKAYGFCQAHYKRLVNGIPVDGPLRARYGIPDIPTKCTAPDCASKHFAKGYCVKHYFRMRKHGTLVRGRYNRVNRIIPLPCSVEGCDAISVGRGLCRKHYNASYRERNAKPIAPERIERLPRFIAKLTDRLNRWESI